MDPTAHVRELWRRQEYLLALTQAWNLDSAFSHSAIRQFETKLDLRGIVFEACHQAVAQVAGRQGYHETAKAWIKDLLERPVPNSLLDHDGLELNTPWCKEHRRRMILAHLLCADAAVDAICQRTVALNSLQAINRKLESYKTRPLPIAFLHDLSRQLSSEVGRRSRGPVTEALFPLASPGQSEGTIAKFVLERLPEGTGEVFVAVEQAFVPMDDDFRQVFYDAPEALMKLRLCSPTTNVSARVERAAHPALIDTPLLGSSSGGALLLGLWSAWTGEPLADNLITSFALACASDSATDGICHSVVFDQTKFNAAAYHAKGLGSTTTILIADTQPDHFGTTHGIDMIRVNAVSDAIRLAVQSRVPRPLTGKPHNLPGARCDKFISRPKVEGDLVQALRSEKPVVWVYGEDGSGKAEVLRHVVLSQLEDLPFEALVWIDVNPADTVHALGIPEVLAVLGRELEIPLLQQTLAPPDFNLATKALKSRTVLIVLQHYDPLSEDPHVFRWFRSLHTCKIVVLSSRTPNRAQSDSAREVKVSNLTLDEREAFLNLCLDNGTVSSFGNPERASLFHVTGGNPSRIAKAVSFLRHGGSLKELSEPHFIRKLIPASFARFGESSRQCLLALSLFPFGAYPDALSYVTTFAEEDIREALWPLGGFVDVFRGTTPMDAPRRTLADAGMGTWLHQHFKDDAILHGMIRRWYNYFEKLADRVGFCWDDPCRLQLLDAPGLAETIRYVMRHAIENKRYRTAIRIGRECRFWQYVRGDWLVEWSPIDVWANAARAIDDKHELFDALVYEFNIRCKQALHAKSVMRRADSLFEEIQTIIRIARPGKVSHDRYDQALALWDLANGRLAEAEERWRSSLRRRLGPHEKSAMQRWLAVCLRRQNKQVEAHEVLLQHLSHVDCKYERPALMTHLNLAELDLESGNTAGARLRLESLGERVALLRDRSFSADYEFLVGKCLLASFETELGRSALCRAREHYDRLGMDAHISEIEGILSEMSQVS